MKRAQTPSRGTRSSKPRVSQEPRTITSTDLRTLSFRELKALYKEAGELLREGEGEDLNSEDVVVEYEVRLVTKDGEVYSNKGRSQLNAILNPRLLADAPRRFELDFHHNVFSPVYAAAFELFDAHNPTQNSTHLLTNGDTDDLPALPEPDPTNLY